MPHYNVVIAGTVPVFTVATVAARSVDEAVRVVMTQAREEHPDAADLKVDEVYRMRHPDEPFYEGERVR